MAGMGTRAIAQGAPAPQAEQAGEPPAPWPPESRANLPSIPDAQLPANYQAAKLALLECSRVDECQDWADKMAAMASYARQADNDELLRLSRRIQARAIERCGELLKQIPEAKPGPKHELADGAGSELLPPRTGRMQAAKEAGLSERQAVTALRVANIPKDEFERQVESDNPPTISALAEQGKKPAAKPLIDLGDRTPEEFKAATALIGIADWFVRQAGAIDVPQAIRGLSAPERLKLAKDLSAAAEWIDGVSNTFAPAPEPIAAVLPRTTFTPEVMAEIDREAMAFERARAPENRLFVLWQTLKPNTRGRCVAWVEEDCPTPFALLDDVHTIREAAAPFRALAKECSEAEVDQFVELTKAPSGMVH
jgi:hypothetical protein